jgi:hypothetical protein
MIQLLESIEPTLGGERVEVHPSAASTGRGRHLRVSPSTYIEALDENTPPAETLPPPLIAPASRSASPFAQTMLPLDTGVAAPVSAKGRGTWLALGGAAVVGMIVTVVIVATSKRGAKGAVVAKETEHHGVAIAAKPAVAPAPVDAPAPAAEARSTGTEAPAKEAKLEPESTARPHRPRANPEIGKLIAEAESAQKAGNRLRQISRADAALRLDPRNVRAKLLLADGLIASGDHDRGCKYLRELGSNAAARERARKASCSAD